MAPLPKRKLSKARQGKRRAVIKLTKPTIITCPSCNGLTKPHQVCSNCGQYKGRQVIIKKEKKPKPEA